MRCFNHYLIIFMINSHHLYLEDSISSSYIFKPIDWKTSSSFSCSQCCFLPHLSTHFSHFMVANDFFHKQIFRNQLFILILIHTITVYSITSAAFSSLSLLLQFLVLSRSVKAGAWKIFLLIFSLVLPFQNIPPDIFTGSGISKYSSWYFHCTMSFLI